MFPFVIPWDDNVLGVATDVSFLNAMPAGKNGRIIAKGGQFVEEQTGQRVRFIGVNLAAKAAFPSHEDAERIAGRLAKLGVNIVRFHHLQNNWDRDGGMIWKPDKVFLELDPKQLDKFDYFVFALKKKGIYSNVNLQTTRSYLPEMGFANSVLQIPDFAKKIDKVDRRMIDLQKQYARDLIGRKNPYTGLRYADDPAVMVLEINNENSLVFAPWESVGAGLRSLPEPFRGEVRLKWNQWLRAKYKTDGALASAWAEGVTPAGASIVTAANKWTWENHNNADMQASGDGGAFTATIRSNDGPDWYIQATLLGLDLAEGSTYTLRFKARSTKVQTVRVDMTLDQADWHNLGLSGSVALKAEWQDYSFTFRAKGVVKDHARVAFAIGNARETLEIKELALSPGMSGPVVPAGQSLPAGSIDLPASGTDRQMSDYVAFLAETEAAYSDEMRRFLRDELGFKKANIIDTQISWGGLTGLKREAGSDYADNHAYWQHPSFPGAAWDMKNWVIGNTPMVGEFDKGYGELGGLAMYRVAGKPYSISEYNHPAPSDYRAEMMPLLSTFAGIQDWDIVYAFDYGTTGTGQDNDRIQGFFACGTDPAKMAFFPAAALSFRGGLVPRASMANTLVLPSTPWSEFLTASVAWGSPPNLYQNRIAIQAGSGVKQTVVSAGTAEKPLAQVERRRKGMVYRFDGTGAKAIVGFVGGEEIALTDAAFRFQEFGNGFASVSIAATDRKPLAGSSRILLTLMGKAENQGMGWNASRTSVGDQWGKGPTVVEGIPCTVTFLADGARTVWALDGNGRRTSRISATYRNGAISFQADPKFKTVWYEIAR